MSARLGEVAGGIGQTNVAQQTPYEAVIDNTVTAMGQNLFVLIPSVDGGRTTKGPVRWSPVPGPNGPIFPSKGDLAQVVRTNEGYYWLTQFIPAIYPTADPKVTVKKFSFANVSSFAIGAVDGNNITGVRLSFIGAINGAGVGVAAPLIRLKPNGATSIPAQAVASRVYTPTPSYAATADATYGGAFATVAGLGVCQKSWAVNNGDEHVSFTGIFFTPISLGWRQWDGTFTARDLGADGNRGLKGNVFGAWQDNTTTVASLTLAIDAGTFSGKLTMEIIP
jgi:hypothetical protein